MTAQFESLDPWCNAGKEFLLDFCGQPKLLVDAFHLLCLLAFCNIYYPAHHLRRLSVRIPEHRPLALHPANSTVRPDRMVLHIEIYPGLDSAVYRPSNDISTVLVHHLIERFSSTFEGPPLEDKDRLSCIRPYQFTRQ